METSLGALLRAWRDVEQQIEDNMGDITPVVEKLQNELELSIPEKVDHFNYFIDNAKALAEMQKKLSDEHAQAARALSNLAARLEHYAKQKMVESEFKQLLGNRTMLSLRKCPKSLVIYDESQIPAQYCTEKFSIEIDKKALKQALESGEEIIGARLEGGAALTRGVNKFMDAKN